MIIMPNRRRAGYSGNDGYTKLLLHFDGANEATSTFDSARSKNVMSMNGGIISTTQSVFGGSSLYLSDSASQSVSTPYSAGFNLGTGNFTIDYRVRPASVSGTARNIFMVRSDPTNNIIHQLGTDGKLIFAAYLGNVAKANYSGASGFSVDTWYHVAVVRNGTSLKIYVDGTAISLTETTAIGTNDIGQASGTAYVGVYSGAYSAYGWIDEFRLSKGIARWTANFTPPTVPYR